MALVWSLKEALRAALSFLDRRSASPLLTARAFMRVTTPSSPGASSESASQADIMLQSRGPRPMRHSYTPSECHELQNLLYDLTAGCKYPIIADTPLHALGESCDLRHLELGCKATLICDGCPPEASSADSSFPALLSPAMVKSRATASPAAFLSPTSVLLR